MSNRDNRLIKDEHQKAIRAWWEEINSQKGRGLRASLRRCAELSDAWQSEGFRALLLKTHTLWKIDGQTWRFTALAIFAAIAAHVKTDDEKADFGAQLGYPKGNGPRLSVLRFTRLQRARTPDDLLRQLRRAVKMLEGKVNLIDLADSILCWCREADEIARHRYSHRPATEFVRIRWAMAYYQAGTADETPDDSTTETTIE